MSDLNKQFEAIEQKLDKTLEGQEKAAGETVTMKSELEKTSGLVVNLKGELDKTNEEIGKIKADAGKLLNNQTAKAKTLSEAVGEALTAKADDLKALQANKSA